MIITHHVLLDDDVRVEVSSSVVLSVTAVEGVNNFFLSLTQFIACTSMYIRRCSFLAVFRCIHDTYLVLLTWPSNIITKSHLTSSAWIGSIDSVAPDIASFLLFNCFLWTPVPCNYFSLVLKLLDRCFIAVGHRWFFYLLIDLDFIKTVDWNWNWDHILHVTRVCSWLCKVLCTLKITFTWVLNMRLS